MSTNAWLRQLAPSFAATCQFWLNRVRGDGQWNIPKLRELLERILPHNGRVEDFEVRHDFPHLGPRVMLLNARRIEPQSGQQMILLYIEDVTQKR